MAENTGIENIIRARQELSSVGGHEGRVGQLDNILLDLVQKECTHCNSAHPLKDFYLYQTQSLTAICHDCVTQDAQPFSTFLEEYCTEHNITY